MDQVTVSQWQHHVSSRFPCLSKTQASLLASLSLGMVLAHCCGLSRVVSALTDLLEVSSSTLRQRVREWYYPASRKRGAHRREVEVEPCFPFLLRWIVSLWDPQDKHLPLVVDATSLGCRFTVLVISVVVRRCALPVAWQVMRSNQPGSWEPVWKRLLVDLHDQIPAEWTVLVLADRGLYAKWLFDVIVSLGWHPFLRINETGFYRPEHSDRFVPLNQAIPGKNMLLSETVTCFCSRQAQLECTLLGCWEEGYQERWLVLTDLPCEQAKIVWYCLRMWVEHGFKDFKRGGWQWQLTRMTDPEYASRLWLAMTVATIWIVSVGAESEVEQVQTHEQICQKREQADALMQPATIVLTEAVTALKQAQQQAEEERQERQEGQEGHAEQANVQRCREVAEAAEAVAYAQAQVHTLRIQLEQEYGVKILPFTHVSRRFAAPSAASLVHGQKESCFARGIRVITAAFWKGQPLPLGRLWPEPWPEAFPASMRKPTKQRVAVKPTRERRLKKQRNHQANTRKEKEQMRHTIEHAQEQVAPKTYP